MTTTASTPVSQPGTSKQEGLTIISDEVDELAEASGIAFVLIGHADPLTDTTHYRFSLEDGCSHHAHVLTALEPDVITGEQRTAYLKALAELGGPTELLNRVCRLVAEQVETAPEPLAAIGEGIREVAEVLRLLKDEGEDIRAVSEDADYWMLARTLVIVCLLSGGVLPADH